MNIFQVKPRSAALLTCLVRGRPKPTIQWLVSGVEVKLSAKLRPDFGEGGEHLLKVEDVGPDDEVKLYTCRAVNEVGEDQTSAKVIMFGELWPCG